MTRFLIATLLLLAANIAHAQQTPAPAPTPVNNADYAPDGKSFAVEVRGNIYLIASDSTAKEPLGVAVAPYREWMAKFSPDGKQIAFLATADHAIDLWVYDVEKRTTRWITNREEIEGYIWSPDGGRIAYVSKDGLKEVNLRTGVVTVLREGTQTIVRSMAYSPDGRWIAYGRRDGPMTAVTMPLYLLDIASKREHRIVDGASLDPVFSPDGKTLTLFYGPRDVPFRLVALNMADVLKRIGAAPGDGRGTAAASLFSPSDLLFVSPTQFSGVGFQFFSVNSERVFFFGRISPTSAGIHSVRPDGSDLQLEREGSFLGIKPTADRSRFFHKRVAPDGMTVQIWHAPLSKEGRGASVSFRVPGDSASAR